MRCCPRCVHSTSSAVPEALRDRPEPDRLDRRPRHHGPHGHPAPGDRLNDLRPDGAPARLAGEIVALGLLHEVGHLVIARYRQPGPTARTTPSRPPWRRSRSASVAGTRRCCWIGSPTEFPGRTARPEPRPARLEALLLLRVANENPAAGPLRELVDDQAAGEARRATARPIAGLEVGFADGPRLGPDGAVPPRAAPRRPPAIPRRRWPASSATSASTGRACSATALAALLARMDIAIGCSPRRSAALHLRFGGGGGPGPAARRPSFAGAETSPRRSRRTATGCRGSSSSRRARTSGSTSCRGATAARSGRSTRSPTRSSTRSPAAGSRGLWLIGLWERSKASERIKRWRGNADAVASAYSLDDYRIADDLGGEAAYADLRDRAWARGIRLASDMVPNHMGIDSRWVIEHPERFIVARRAALPRLHVRRARTCRRRRASRSASRTTTGTTPTPPSSSSGATARPATTATSITATTGRASRGTTPPSSTSSRPTSARRSSRRSSTSPGASRSSASTPRWSSPRSTSSGSGGPSPGSPAASRRAPSTRCPGRTSTGAMPRRVLARGRRPGRRRGAGHAPPRRGVLAAGGLLRPDARHAPRLQQRVHAHAPRRGQRGLPQGHPRHPRVRPGDPQAVRQLHDEPRRGDRDRAVRHGRQVLRRRDAPRDAAGPADDRPRPDRGLHREVRDGVPAGDARRAARSLAARALRARDRAAPPRRAWFAGAQPTSCCTTS